MSHFAGMSAVPHLLSVCDPQYAAAMTANMIAVMGNPGDNAAAETMIMKEAIERQRIAQQINQFLGWILGLKSSVLLLKS